MEEQEHMDAPGILEGWPHRVAYFPMPYTDETLGSLIARYGERTSSPTPESAMRSLACGVLRSHGRLDAWTQLFVRTLKTDLDLDAVTILRNNTMLHYVSAFWTAERRRRLMSSLHDPAASLNTASLDTWLLFGTRSGYLRWCPECAREDDAANGEVYWHREHQLPWSNCCPVHHRVLRHAIIPGTIAYPLSTFVTGNVSSPSISTSRSDADAFATWSVQLLKGRLGPFDPDGLRPVYRDQLARTDPRLLTPRADAGELLLDILEETLGDLTFLRVMAGRWDLGWHKFFNWIWSDAPVAPPGSVDMHLMFWAACSLDPEELPVSSSSN
ncbi:MAG: TniQ family protein [Candidatus Cryosericum sp.]